MSSPMEHRREGFALFVTILCIFALSAITLSALKIGSDEASAGRATRVSAAALYAAEAGIRATQVAWPVPGPASLAAGDSMVTAWTMLANGSRFRSVIHRRDSGAGPLVYSLTTVGQSSGPPDLRGEATVQVWLTRSNARTFVAAVASRSSASFSSSGYTDSYDSSIGLYGGSNVENTGHVRVNTTLSISGSAQIRGDVTVGSSTFGATSAVTGTVTTSAPSLTYPQEPCPTGGFSPFGPQAGVSYSQTSGKLSTGDSVVVVAGTYYFYEVTLSGGAQLIVPPGQIVTIYIGNKFTVSGGGGVNNRSRIPANLSIISCGPNTQAWSLSGGSDGYFTVYAPNNKISLTGGSPVFGAITAGEFVSSGGAPVHFDRALASGGEVARVIGRSWSQLMP
jgi:hypothetical protein